MTTTLAKVTFPPYVGNNTYTYKTDSPVNPGEHWVVETPTNGYQVVQVQSTEPAPLIDEDLPYKIKTLMQKVTIDG